MKPYRVRLLTLVPLLALALAVAIGPEPSRSRGDDPKDSPVVLPGGRPQDTDAAVHAPEEFAWSLFLALCRQGNPDKPGEVDPGKPDLTKYDDDKPVVWETWAMSSGGRAGGFYNRPNVSEVFRDKGEKPVEWGTWQRAKAAKPLERFPVKRLAGFLERRGHVPGAGLPRIDPSLFGSDVGEEVRMNRVTYDHVRDNGLYSVEGLEEKFSKRVAISFPQSAQEVKANWIKIDDKNKVRYHWRTITRDGQTELWGLSGLHIITRDLPNWFWTDFEHVDFEKNAELDSRDPTTRGQNPPKGQDGVRNETKGSKWENYRLRGTQADFTDSRGQITLLANTQIEHGFQQTSSCVSCHSRATVGLRSARPDFPKWRSNSLPIFNATTPVLVGASGSPKPEWFVNEFLQPRFTQTDFLWSLPFRVLSTTDDPPAN